MAKQYRVVITKVLEDIWGMDELFHDLHADGLPDTAVQAYAEDLLREDIQALLEGAEFKIEEASQ